MVFLRLILFLLIFCSFILFIFFESVTSEGVQKQGLNPSENRFHLLYENMWTNFCVNSYNINHLYCYLKAVINNPSPFGITWRQPTIYCISFLLFLTLPSRLGLKNTPTVTLQRSKTLPLQRVSGIWNQSIWWWGSSDIGALGNAEYPFIAIAPRSIRAWSGSTWLGPIYALNRTKLRTYAKLNCLKWNCFWHWNSTNAKLNCLKYNCFDI